MPNGRRRMPALPATIRLVDDHVRSSVHAAIGGDPAALGELFGRNLPKLVAFLRVHAGNRLLARESASDLAQSVCREVLADAHRLDYRGEEAFRKMLFLQATRKILDRDRYVHGQCRSPAREVRAGGADSEGADLLDCYATLGTPSRHAGAREELERFENALAQLPEEQRQVVGMHRLLQLSYEEIASQLQKTESAVRGLVARGLARLSTLLREPGPPAPG